MGLLQEEIIWDGNDEVIIQVDRIEKDECREDWEICRLELPFIYQWTPNELRGLASFLLTQANYIEEKYSKTGTKKRKK